MTLHPVRAPDLREERALNRQGHLWVAGLDEVGRGAWAGPLTVGVTLMPSGEKRRRMPPWLRDSKMLSEERRESIFDSVAAWCGEWAVGHASPEECDLFGMTAAWRLAACRALDGLSREPDAIIIDGPLNLLRGADEPAFAGVVRTVVGGDARCASVAAASVLAKVVRDRMMRAQAEHFPAYDFERNKGYPSPVHQCALRGYGLTSIHRRSWSYVSELPWSWGARFQREGAA
ncbi:MAG TPA: ribonuclease HII [Acidimicrobiales bacterium]|nr:ribonuclease HII [Acidimicrobiales bacterium]